MAQEDGASPVGRRQGVTQWDGPPQAFDEAGPVTPFGAAACSACDGCAPCGVDCFSPCDFVECGRRFWFRGDYLLWWTKSAELPPLVTTNPDNTTPQDEAGILDADGTQILFGGGNANQGSRPGARFTFSFFPNCDDSSGIEIGYMFLSDKTARYRATSQNGETILARPFFDTGTNQQSAVLLAYTGVAQVSNIAVDFTNDFQSLELLSRQALYRDAGRRVDVLFGYRYARFAERLSISHQFTNGPNGSDLVPVGAVIAGSEAFAGSNEFNGGEIGISAQTRHYRWSFEGLAKLALGGTRSRVSINGQTTVDYPSPGFEHFSRQGALLAQTTNIGLYSKDSFTAIPEVGVTVGFDITSRLKATFGYSVVYWGQVARPGDQIDVGKVAGSSVVNINSNPPSLAGDEPTGTPAPQFRFTTTEFWAQGMNFGLDWRF